MRARVHASKDELPTSLRDVDVDSFTIIRVRSTAVMVVDGSDGDRDVIKFLRDS